MGKAEDVIGKVFGEITVIARSTKKQHVVGICSCNVQKDFLLPNLKNGSTKRCRACWRKNQEQRKKPTDLVRNNKNPTYNSWAHMIDRCTNENFKQYHDYGGRGITVCNRWIDPKGFENFLEDMGVRPDGLTLERVDNDKNYESNNCRWADRVEQQINRGIYTNNTSGVKGVGWDSSRKKWKASLNINDETVLNARFDTFGQAVEARKKAEEIYYKLHLKEITE